MDGGPQGCLRVQRNSARRRDVSQGHPWLCCGGAAPSGDAGVELCACRYTSLSPLGGGVGMLLISATHPKPPLPPPYLHLAAQGTSGHRNQAAE